MDLPIEPGDVAFVRLVVDAVVLNLVMAFDKAPELIEQTALEPVA
jgi:hypothetical protein